MLDLLYKRRSIRKFKAEAVEQELIDQLMQAALLSPSSRKKRPWQFIVVDDKDTIEKLSKAKEHGSSFLKDAPLGIVVLGDKQVCDVWVEDCSIASIILQLTAEKMKLGSCWIQIRKRMHNEFLSAEEYTRHILKIPEHLNILSIIAIGIPDEEKIAHSKEELPFKKVHKNLFGN